MSDTRNSIFLLIGTIMLLLGTVACREEVADEPSDFFGQMVERNDERVASLLEQQEMEPSSDNLGGFANRYGIYNPGSTASIFRLLTTAYVIPQSTYYQSPQIMESMLLAIDFLLRKQHEDGTIDLLTTNFHSTPDLGFAVEHMALSYKVMEAAEVGDDVLLKMEAFLERGGEALSLGGIHTPNHRWVVSMALARLYELFGRESYLERINTWLNEQIDIDEDGQYTERSTSIYSPLTDRCLITIAKILGKEDLYDPVRRNLDMSVYLIHPNGEVVTEISRRQDQYQARYPTAYFYPYRFMALLDEDPVYGAMSNMIQENLGPESLSRDLIYFLEDSSLRQQPMGEDLPDRYEKYFDVSEIVRFRDGKTDASLLAGNPAFFTMHNGSAVLQAIRLSASFFGKGQFQADTLMVRADGSYRLRQELFGPYYQPYPVDSLPDDGDWEKMPRSNRPQSEIQQLVYTVDLSKRDTGYILDFNVVGTDHVPVALELAFRKEGNLMHVVPDEQVDDSYFLINGSGEYHFEGDIIRFGPALHDHQWTQLRGAEPKLDANSVYLTGYTPFNYRLEIKSE